jgi:hypothetical protein
MTLTEFVTARLNEDEAAAKAACGIWRANSDGNIVDDSYAAYIAVGPYGGEIDEVSREHILRYDPTRMLVEVATKRKILNQLMSDLSYRPQVPSGRRRAWATASLIVEAMAAVWSDHPDYDPAWA